MKGIIYYYSSTGNTKLACEALAKHLIPNSFELIDVLTGKNISLDSYDIVGFAAFTDFTEISQVYVNFLKAFPIQNKKPAFIFSTYGGKSGPEKVVMYSLLADKGFHIIAGHSLHMPHSNPPTVAGDYGILYNKIFRPFDSPNKKEVFAFKTFINNLKSIILDIQDNKEVKKYKPHFNLIYAFFRVPRQLARAVMGDKFVDENLCNKCGICADNCPYSAIVMRNYPYFDMQKCYGCWRCFNVCPNKAIYTKKYRGRGHYKLQVEELKEKLF
jgi:ferredoxin